MSDRSRRWIPAAILSIATVSSGCHSLHVETTVENRTGEAVQLLEVDYPSASFGKNVLAADAEYHYRFQVRGSGKLKVTYTSAAGKPVAIEGPELKEGGEGRMEIVLLPAGKAEFHSEVTAER
jgi:hypothetical protein